LIRDALNFPKVRDLIRRDSQQALRLEGPMNRGQKIVCHDPPTPMPPLGPGIGKHQMK
jgi:hypothetical protein